MSTDRLHSRAPGATKPSRRLAFSTPMGVSAVAVLAVAIIGALLVFGPRGLFGLGLGSSPSPEWATPTSIASVDPIATAKATPSVTPMPSRTSAATLQPTPTPTPPAAWTGLDWEVGTIVAGCDDCTVVVNDVLSWEDRYLGVGGVFYGDPDPDGIYWVDSIRAFAAAFLTSTDGAEWSVADQGQLIDFQQYEGIEDYGGVLETDVPHHLIALPGGLLAVGSDNAKSGKPPALWGSDDGVVWTTLDSPDWRGVWGSSAPNVGGLTTLVEVAGGRSGAVAIGFDGGGCCLTPPGLPVITYSPDGLVWERLDMTTVPSMDDRSLLTDVLAHGGGFVIVGSAREPDQPRETQPMPAEVGRPSAWTSTDGRTWVAADVEGSSVPLGRLTQVAAGAEGFFAIGIAQAREYQWQSSGWASADGHTWRLVGELGVDLPRMRVLASDGIHMTAFGTPTLYSLELAGWSSTDGAEWSPLAMSGSPQRPNGDTRFLDPDGTEGYSTEMTAITDAWAVPAGVVVTQPMPGPVGGQRIWVATAVER